MRYRVVLFSLQYGRLLFPSEERFLRNEIHVGREGPWRLGFGVVVMQYVHVINRGIGTLFSGT